MELLKIIKLKSKRTNIQYLTIRTSREYPVMVRICCQSGDIALVTRMHLQKGSMLTIPKLNTTSTICTNKGPAPEPRTLSFKQHKVTIQPKTIMGR